MINCTYKKSNKKVWAVIGLALIGGIFALLGNSLTVKANAQVLDDNFDYSVGVCTLDDHFKIETYDDVKGKYHKDNFCNRSFFCIYDGTYNSYNVFFAPKNGYYWSVGASYPQVPPTLLKNSYEMVDLTRGGSGGYPIQIGMRADSYEGFSFYEDTWNQGIDGLPNSNVTVGTGLILSRDVKYNKNLEKTYQPYQSISNLYNTLKNSPKRRMEVMRIKEECDLEITVCYHVFVEGEEIVCTGGHPFYVLGIGFVEARNLKTSDKLLLSNGKEAIAVYRRSDKRLESKEKRRRVLGRICRLHKRELVTDSSNKHGDSASNVWGQSGSSSDKKL